MFFPTKCPVCNKKLIENSTPSAIHIYCGAHGNSHYKIVSSLLGVTEYLKIDNFCIESFKLHDYTLHGKMYGGSTSFSITIMDENHDYFSYNKNTIHTNKYYGPYNLDKIKTLFLFK